jgi:hypothetical protein
MFSWFGSRPARVRVLVGALALVVAGCGGAAVNRAVTVFRPATAGYGERLELTVNDGTVREGTRGSGRPGRLVVTVTLNKPATSPVALSVRTQDGTATAPSDYTASAARLRFARGQRLATFTVPIVGDRLREATEFFRVRASDATGAVIVRDSAAGFIVDDD